MATPTIRYNSKGAKVADLQRRLLALGFNPGRWTESSTTETRRNPKPWFCLDTEYAEDTEEPQYLIFVQPPRRASAGVPAESFPERPSEV